VATNGINSVADLRGKRIAYDIHGSTVERETLAILQSAGLTESDVEMLGVGESPNRAAAVSVGQVDAAVLSVPDNLRTADVAHTVVRVGDVFSAPLAGISSSQAHLRANPQEATNMVRGVLQGTAFIKANKAAVVQKLATFANLTPEQASSVYDDVVGTWSDTGIVSDANIISTLTDPQLAASADVSKLVDWSYARNAAS
jgi:ABC-type nitrate/sulfonate/bicarbonate transport system substrate-binding protein